MKWPLIFTLTFAAAILSARVHACDCAQNTLKHSIRHTDVVISGRFITGEKLWELSKDNKNGPALYYTGRFVVTQVLKGKTIRAGDTLRITSDFSNCSTRYENDRNYLLFAGSDEGGIKTNICSYSGKLDEDKTKKNLKQTKRLLSNLR